MKNENEITKVSKIKYWAGIIRDIGLIIGVPTLIVIGMQLYSLQRETLEARIKLLEETQYDRALSLIKSEKELFEREREKLENKIGELQRSSVNKDTEIQALNKNVTKHTQRIQRLTTRRYKTLERMLGLVGSDSSDTPAGN